MCAITRSGVVVLNVANCASCRYVKRERRASRSGEEAPLGNGDGMAQRPGDTRHRRAKQIHSRLNTRPAQNRQLASRYAMSKSRVSPRPAMAATHINGERPSSSNIDFKGSGRFLILQVFPFASSRLRKDKFYWVLGKKITKYKKTPNMFPWEGGTFPPLAKSHHTSPTSYAFHYLLPPPSHISTWAYLAGRTSSIIRVSHAAINTPRHPSCSARPG